jgi:hypothetical protein
LGITTIRSVSIDTADTTTTTHVTTTNAKHHTTSHIHQNNKFICRKVYEEPSPTYKVPQAGVSRGDADKLHITHSLTSYTMFLHTITIIHKIAMIYIALLLTLSNKFITNTHCLYFIHTHSIQKFHHPSIFQLLTTHTTTPSFNHDHLINSTKPSSRLSQALQTTQEQTFSLQEISFTTAINHDNSSHSIQIRTTCPSQVLPWTKKQAIPSPITLDKQSCTNVVRVSKYNQENQDRLLKLGQPGIKSRPTLLSFQAIPAIPICRRSSHLSTLNTPALPKQVALASPIMDPSTLSTGVFWKVVALSRTPSFTSSGPSNPHDPGPSAVVADYTDTALTHIAFFIIAILH